MSCSAHIATAMGVAHRKGQTYHEVRKDEDLDTDNGQIASSVRSGDVGHGAETKRAEQSRRRRLHPATRAFPRSRPE